MPNNEALERILIDSVVPIVAVQLPIDDLSLLFPKFDDLFIPARIGFRTNGFLELEPIVIRSLQRMR